MIMKSNMNITYAQVGDYLIPNIILPPEEANIRLGKWGLLHKDYLSKHKKVVFTTLFAEGKLWKYLTDINYQAQKMFDNFVEQMKTAEGVTEQLKEENQMEWIRRMNNIRNIAMEIVNAELIFNA